MKNTQDGFIIPLVIAIIAAVAIGGGAYVYQRGEENAVPEKIDVAGVNQASTSSVAVVDTKEWKEYKDDAYKFTIKHPSDWPITFVDNTLTIGATEPDPVDRYTKCYVKLVLNRPGEGNQPYVPHKTITSLINEMERSERCNETLNKIIESFSSIIDANAEFPVVSGSTYAKTKVALAAKGWVAVVPASYEINSGLDSTKTPIVAEYPEIGYCGSGRDSVCTVDFKKGGQVRFLILQSKNSEWIVVGGE